VWFFRSDQSVLHPPLALTRPQTTLLRRNKFAHFCCALNLDHFKVFFASAAIWARPIRRHIFPARAGGYAVGGQAFSLVVNPATHQTHPSFVRGHIQYLVDKGWQL
jgi:hypothetical protein